MDKNQSLVSVIVPCYNQGQFLSETLESVLSQTYSNWECIIVNDCSTDNIREILECYRNHPKVSNLIYNDVNAGTSYKQLYKGIHFAKGELIWIAESDDGSDWSKLGKLNGKLSYFRRHSEAASDKIHVFGYDIYRRIGSSKDR